jgi:hypothetical protein
MCLSFGSVWKRGRTEANLPDLSVANISAPHCKMMLLENLGIELCIIDGEDDFEHNHSSLTLLRRFECIHTLDLLTYYPPVSPLLCHHCNVSIDNEEKIEFQPLQWYSTCFGLLMSLQHCITAPNSICPST